MGETECYAMVRGSAVRVTGLGQRGSIPDTIPYAVSKSIAKVTINEVTESASNEALGSEQEDNETRLRFVRAEQLIRYTVDIDFLRCDPGVLSLITGVPLVYKNAHYGDDTIGFGEGAFGELDFGGASEGGFGEIPFGDYPFGGFIEPDAESTVVGFDYETRRPPVSFGLEVWSKLAASACVAGQRQYGYTVFPFLRGGRMTGFEFKNGLVSFSIRGAQTRKAARWGVGPYNLEGVHQRLLQPVSRNTMYRQMLTTAPPPEQQDGIQETEDVIRGGTASVTSSDVISGGNAASTSPWIIYGGQAV